jgi:hypothetical protein
MSGEFRPEQQQSIESTDNPDLARRFGLTRYDRETGQYTAPTAPDAGERDSGQLAEALAENARLSDELAERDAEIARLRGEQQDGIGGDEQDVTEHDERTPGAPNVAGEHGGTPPGFTPAEPQGQPTQDGGTSSGRRGSKASQSK